LTSLVKKLDAEAAKKKGVKVCVVFLSNEEGLEAKIKSLIEKEKLTRTDFGIDNPVGPPAYKIAKEADVTAIFYAKRKITANHAYKKGGLTSAEVEKVVASMNTLG